MISHNPQPNCKDVRPYYYDALNEETQGDIPGNALDHIAHCRDCQAEMDRLEVVLAHAQQSAEREQSRKDAAISVLLRLHFAYLGERVNCAAVKPFLPSLADPLLRIRIRTPITRHLEECPACSAALTSVRALHLSHKQLCYLGQLLADEPTAGEVSCSQARAAIPAIVSIAFHRTNATILKHVCSCPDCRKQLYLHREAVRQKLLRSQTPPDRFPCKVVSASDIYGYALPYGLDPANDQYAEFRKPLAAHVHSCPACLARLQELHRTVCGIAERAESGIVTVHHLDEAAEVQPLSGSVEVAAGAVTRVEEDGGRTDAATIVDFAARLKRKASTLNVRPLLKAGAIAAAVLIGLALLLNAPVAKAVTLDQVYRAVERVRSVYFATFAGDETEPVQEQWLSQGLNAYLDKKGSLWVLYDIGTGIQKSKDAGTGALKPKEGKLNEDEITYIKGKMSLASALMPFQNPSDVPANAHWNRVTDAILQANTEGTEVYDLTWTDRTYGGLIHKKWRAFVDPQTNLPRRLEFYQKKSVDGQYRLTWVRQIGYMTDAEIEAVIDSLSF